MTGDERIAAKHIRSYAMGYEAHANTDGTITGLSTLHKTIREMMDHGYVKSRMSRLGGGAKSYWLFTLTEAGAAALEGDK